MHQCVSMGQKSFIPEALFNQRVCFQEGLYTVYLTLLEQKLALGGSPLLMSILLLRGIIFRRFHDWASERRWLNGWLQGDEWVLLVFLDLSLPSEVEEP